MELAAEAAAFFILKFEELRGEMMDGAFGVAHLGNIRERTDEADNVTVGVKLRNDVSKGPEGFFRAWITKTDERIVDRNVRAEDLKDGAPGLWDVCARLVDDGDPELRKEFADRGAIGKVEHAVGSSIGKFNAGIGGVKNNGEVEIADQRAEAFFVGTEEIFGLLALSNVANDDESAALALDVKERDVHQADANTAILGAKKKLDIAGLSGGGKAGQDVIALRGVDPKIHLAGRLAEGFLAGVAGKTGEAFVQFEVRAVGERVDAESVGAIAKGGGKDLFGAAEIFFGFEEIIRDAALLLIGEDQSDRRANDGGGHGEPG